MQGTNREMLKERLLQEFDKFYAGISDFALTEAGAHDIEQEVLSGLLGIGQLAMSGLIAGKIESVEEGPLFAPNGEQLRCKGVETRQYLSIFGPMVISRQSYWGQSVGKVHVADERLQLPKGSQWSYILQELVGECAAENDFRESVNVVNKLLKLNLSGKSSERNAGSLGSLVGAYYESSPPKTEDGPVSFYASFDGKGVPKIKDRSAQTGENPKKRLGKGEKPGPMQMATVTATSGFAPKKRTKESILWSLMGRGSPAKGAEAGQKSGNGWHEGIHRRAFLGDQQKAVEYGIGDIRARMKNPDSRFMVAIDGGIGLEEKVLAVVLEMGLQPQFEGIILDIIHVNEYVWDAASALFGEKSKSRASWVEAVMGDLLDSKTDKVVKDLKAIAQKTKLTENKLNQINKTITYFTNHKHKMDYKRFLEKGFPISTALAESTCGFLVKKRMEQGGMRWSSNGAQNILDLRAVKLNNDTTQFMKFVIKAQHPHAFKRAA